MNFKNKVKGLLLFSAAIVIFSVLQNKAAAQSIDDIYCQVDDNTTGLVGCLGVDSSGVYRIRHRDLIAQGINLIGLPVRNIAVTYQGESVPRRIINRKKRHFNHRTVIEIPVAFKPTLYNKIKVLQLHNNRSLAKGINVDKGTPAGFTDFNHIRKLSAPFVNLRISQQKVSLTSLASDLISPEELLSGETQVYDRRKTTFELTDNNFVDVPVKLKQPYSSSYISEVASGAVEISVNGKFRQRVDLEYSLNDANSIEIEIPSGVLNAGENTIIYKNTGAYPYTANLYFNTAEISYQSKNLAQNNSFFVKSQSNNVFVENFDTNTLYAYRLEEDAYYLLSKVAKREETAGKYVAWLKGNENKNAEYIISPIKRPLIKKLDNTFRNIKIADTEYLIITHDNYLSAVQPLADYRASQYRVTIAPVSSIYSQFGGGMMNPQAIKDYIAWMAGQNHLKMVLLVGDDVNNYHNNYHATGSVPAMYSYGPDDRTRRKLSTQYTSGADIMFADDSAYVEGLTQKIGLGRWPVSSTTEVNNIVYKTIAYDSISRARNVMAIGDRVCGYATTRDQCSFYIHLDRAINAGETEGSDGYWTTSYQPVNAQGSAQTQQNLINEAQSGLGLVYFLGGHYGAHWGNTLGISQVPLINNASKPFAVIHEDSYQHGFTGPYRYAKKNIFSDEISSYKVSADWSLRLAESLIKENSGAAISLGTSTLFSGVKYEYPGFFGKGQKIGDAVANMYYRYRQYYNLYGDPALKINP